MVVLQAVSQDKLALTLEQFKSIEAAAKPVEIRMSNASLSFSPEVLKASGLDLSKVASFTLEAQRAGEDKARELAARSKNANIYSLKGSVFQLSVRVKMEDNSDQELKQFNGKITVTLPVPSESRSTAAKGGLYAGRFNEVTGQWDTVPGTYDAVSGTYRFETDSFSQWGLVEKVVLQVKTFSDISDHWARKDIEYMASNGYISGMGGGLYSPDDSRNLLALMLVVFITLAAAGPALAYDSDSNIDLLGSGKMSFNAWYSFDKNLAGEKVADGKNNVEQLKYTMLAQWETIAGELSRAQSGFYLDSKYGFKIYSPEVSGKIHVLTLAKAYREAVLAAAGTGDVSGVPYPDLARTDRSFIPAAELAVSQQAKYVTVEQTVQAIMDIPLPDNLFKGLTVYLLPYEVIRVSDQLGGVSGFHSGRFSGRDELIYITSLSRDETGGFPPAATTITHEVGHYIHNILLGTHEKYPDRWKPFMDLGGQKDFVQSGSWSLLTEENFAEYFRMTYGNKEASAYPYKASYPAPDAKNISAFKALLAKNIAREVPGYWDYDSLKITVKGPNGKSIQLGVGPKHGRFVSLATAFPELVLEGSLSTADARIPCIVFYESIFKQCIEGLWLWAIIPFPVSRAILHWFPIDNH